MVHLGGLLSTQEARVALGCRLVRLLRFRSCLATSRVYHNSIVHAMAFTICLMVFTPGGVESHIKQTGMLVGNFEFNP